MTTAISLNGVVDGHPIEVGLEEDGSILLQGRYDEIFLATAEARALYFFLKEHYEPQLSND